MSNNTFDNLFIFEMANNHQGSLEHGLKIVRTMAEIARCHGIRAAVKLQYRELDTMIHAAYQDRKDVKHIPRFMDARLDDGEFETLARAIHDEGLVLVITPFDEPSVAKAVAHGVDILKVASCSAMDWPLLGEVAASGKPVIISSAGIGLHDIDRVASFFTHREVPFALLHCVGMYPAPAGQLCLNFITKMRSRYRGVPIGYSGHEDPGDLDPVRIAVSKDAMILERHVGIATDAWPLNAYSSTPEQVGQWVEAALRARDIGGQGDEKSVSVAEEDSLRTLMRGVYAARPISKGAVIERDDVYFAMPCTAETMTSGEFGLYRARFVATCDYPVDAPVCEAAPPDEIRKVRDIVHDARGMLYEAQIELGLDIQIELSHHYGIDAFRRYGAVIASVVNRSYCKKVILVFPGQKNPSHYHRKKEETFQVLWGTLEVDLDGCVTVLKPGQTMLIEPGQPHDFSSIDGAIFEEVSTTHEPDDSVYLDERIARMDVLERKTVVENW